MLGDWCHVTSNLVRQVYEHHKCFESNHRTISLIVKRNSFDGRFNHGGGEDWGCHFKKIRRLPNGSYFAHAICGAEGADVKEDLEFKIVEEQLEMKVKIIGSNARERREIAQINAQIKNKLNVRHDRPCDAAQDHPEKFNFNPASGNAVLFGTAKS
jgi:hypothetical protein